MCSCCSLMANFQAVIRSVTDRSYRWTGGSTAAAAADSQGAGGWLAEASAVDVDGAAASADGKSDGETMVDTVLFYELVEPSASHASAYDDGRAGAKTSWRRWPGRSQNIMVESTCGGRPVDACTCMR
mmetsp:Transcript_13104/g.29894  ORF Transcript_13104/g.29894 Transcript_13104/m.29894 type:complete len:128 (-) Transcript_13104:3-386(-)